MKVPRALAEQSYHLKRVVKPGTTSSRVCHVAGLFVTLFGLSFFSAHRILLIFKINFLNLVM